MIFLINFYCPRCGSIFDQLLRPVSCTCGSPIKSSIDWSDLDVDSSAPGMWRYRSVLPETDPVISMGEGWTPLIPSRSKDLFYKLEYISPTGSFKDRGAVLVVSEANSLGCEAVVQDSSGNAGSSIAAYAARSGIKATIIVPKDTPESKKRQIELYGAVLEVVDGDRKDAARVAMTIAENVYYASHVWNPLFLEGTKTVAFEIWEQLGHRAPDAVVVPAGNGTIMLGIFKGFKELLQRVRIKRLPRIYAVQGAACAPLHAQWKDTGESVFGPTLAEGIAIASPPRIKEMLDAVRVSRGDVLVVDDGSILAEQERLALEEGLLVEPTAAAAPAAERILRKSGRISERETVVVPLTGSGLKKMPQKRTKKQASPEEGRPLFDSSGRRIRV